MTHAAFGAEAEADLSSALRDGSYRMLAAAPWRQLP